VIRVDDRPVRTYGDAMTGEAAPRPLSNRELHALRERFVTDPVNTDLSDLRPVIARSWRRSRACNVSPDVPSLTVGEVQLGEQILRCAEPVLERLEQTVLDTGGCVTLSDAAGRLAVFRGERPAVHGAKDLFPIFGGSALEEVTGTNSDGTAIEEAVAVQVFGAEHFAEAYADLCCTSVPIRDPLRRSVQAVLALTLPTRVVPPETAQSIALIVEGAAAEITRALADRLAVREQVLMNGYLREVRKRGTDAVVAMDERTVISSNRASQLLAQSDYSVLAGYAREAERRRAPVERDVTLDSGRVLHVHVTPVEDGSVTTGSILRLQPAAPAAKSRPPRRSASRTDRFPSLVGESAAFRRALDVAGTVVERAMPAYILGDAGTGKFHLAREMAAKLSDRTVSVDCRGDELSTDADVERLGQHLDDGSAVVLRHVDSLPAGVRSRLAEFLTQTDQRRVIMTALRLTDDTLELTAALRGIEIQMPSLRRRREDIPLLVRHFLDRLPDGPSRASAKLLQTLTEADWSGNVRQLEEAVDQAAAQSISDEIRVDDLSHAHRKAMARNPLSRLEEAELQLIRDALAEAEGNRVKAATLLQIGRSTLYRKIDTYTRRGFDLGLE
jgi:sigma-54 dependent transcriptional regulator, acetoin dehydrogenase operon transcriptional activator AcoR